MFSYEDIRFKERIFSDPLNVLYLVRKTVRQYLSEPYGQCNRYESREQRSRTQCYRQCVQNQYNNRYNCVPIFIDYYNHDLDLKYKDIRSCENLFNSTELPMMQEIKEKCRKVCHKECYQVHFSTKIKETGYTTESNNNENIENTVLFNNEEPTFVYTEEPVLTFTSYLVYCGGLMGLWFGASAHDIIVLILDSTLLRKFLNYCKNIIQKLVSYIQG